MTVTNHVGTDGSVPSLRWYDEGRRTGERPIEKRLAPEESTTSRPRAAGGAGDPVAVGRVYRDADGRRLIDTHHLACTLDPDLNEDEAMETLADLEVSHDRALGFARNLFEVRPLEGEVTLEAASRFPSTRRSRRRRSTPTATATAASWSSARRTTRNASTGRCVPGWRLRCVTTPRASADRPGRPRSRSSPVSKILWGARLRSPARIGVRKRPVSRFDPPVPGDNFRVTGA